MALVAGELALLLWLAQQLLPLLRFCLFTSLAAAGEPQADQAAHSLGGGSGTDDSGMDLAGSLQRGPGLQAGSGSHRWTCSAMGSPWAKLALVALVLFDAACTLFVANLLLLHLYLAATGQTTLELLKVRHTQPGIPVLCGHVDM